MYLIHSSLFLLIAAFWATGSSAAGKRGITYSSATWRNLLAGNPQVTWGYNWEMEANGLDSSLEYVPVLWGAPSEPDPNWTAAAEAAENVFGYNEPDLNGQAIVIPSIAAASWETRWRPQYMGLGCLDAFSGICDGFQFDFIPVHWYANESAANFEAYISLVHDKYQEPTWVTEFTLQDSEANQIAFLKEVMPWMDSQDSVERYSYFGAFETYLLDGSGTALNNIGKTFASYTG